MDDAFCIKILHSLDLYFDVIVASLYRPIFAIVASIINLILVIVINDGCKYQALSVVGLDCEIQCIIQFWRTIRGHRDWIAHPSKIELDQKPLVIHCSCNHES